MGDTKNREVEVVNVGSRQAEAVSILQHYLGCAKRGELQGVVVLVELPRGGYRASMTGTTNVAERLGRLHLLADEVLEKAEEIED